MCLCELCVYAVKLCAYVVKLCAYVVKLCAYVVSVVTFLILAYSNWTVTDQIKESKSWKL